MEGAGRQASRARVVGVLFIVATLMGIASGGVMAPVTAGGDVLAGYAASAGTVAIAALLNVVMAASVVAIAVAMYPVLRQGTHTLAAGYLAARTVEGALLLAATAIWPALVVLGMRHMGASAAEPALLQAVADALGTLADILFTLAVMFAFGASAVLLNLAFLRLRLVPGWIAWWGLVGGGLLVVSGVLTLAGQRSDMMEMVLSLPIAINEMVLAVWLIVRGFDFSSSEAGQG